MMFRPLYSEMHWILVNNCVFCQQCGGVYSLFWFPVWLSRLAEWLPFHLLPWATVAGVCLCPCFQPSFKQIRMWCVSFLHLWQLPLYLSLFPRFIWRLHCKMASLLVPVCLSYKLQAPAAAVEFSSFWWFEPPDLSWRGVPTCLGGILNEWNFFPAHEVGEESLSCCVDHWCHPRGTSVLV